MPAQPKIYHIVHVDRLASILADGCLWCDAEVLRLQSGGTTIGMSGIKERRLNLSVNSHVGLQVGGCVPFYFCPRSVMLYLIHMANHPELDYKGGQDPIVHLEADLRATVAWASGQRRRWAFTLSNAGSYFFEDRANLAQLGELDWAAVQARDWRNCKDGKQAEFLLEHSFPWTLVERIGVHTMAAYRKVIAALAAAGHRPRVEVIDDWYY
jgi:hypothetical protein